MAKTVRLYVKPDCPLCDEALALLSNADTKLSFDVKVIDIEPDPVLIKLYDNHVPVADFGNQVRLYWPFTVEDVQGILGSPEAALPPPGTVPAAGSGCNRALVIFLNKFVAVFSRYWLPIIGFFIAIYVMLPLLAPVLMAAGAEKPANLIYTAYRLSCHQLPSRSFFVFGHQVAYCQRCTGIYTALLAAVPFFFFLRGRLKPLPWPAYLAFIAPLGIDGITQLLGLRSSSWELRAITGALFGIGSAWLALPYLETGFGDAQKTVRQNLKTD